MKMIDIAVKDLTRAFRSKTALAFMLGLPLMVTGLFYLMFGGMARNGGFDFPRITVAVANLDRDAPRLQAGSSLPAGIRADTMSALVVEILRSDELEHLLAISIFPDAEAARQAVDRQEAQVAVIIPAGFSHQFADPDGQAEVELYQDPTLTIGPEIVQAILDRFLHNLSGIKIVIDQTLDEVDPGEEAVFGLVLMDYLDRSRAQTADLASEFLDIQTPPGVVEQGNPVLAIITPIMGGMMVFYAFYTGVNTAQSILLEDEQRTLQRLFTTPTSRSAILAGKFLAVFLTVLIQVIALTIAARLIFGIQWGAPVAVAMAILGIVACAATSGIFINSLIRDTRQSGIIYGGVLTVTGMLGMVRIFAFGQPAAARLGDTVGLLVPQGWAVRGLLEALGGQAPEKILPTLLVLLAWSTVFFIAGVWRFQKRYG